MQENLNDLFRMLGARLMHTSDQHEAVCVNPSIFENLRKAVISAQEELETLRAENEILKSNNQSIGTFVLKKTCAILSEREELLKQNAKLIAERDELIHDRDMLKMCADQYEDELKRMHAEREAMMKQEPVVLAHVSIEDDGPVISVEVLDGAKLQPEMSPIKLFALPAQQIPEGYAESEFEKYFQEIGEDAWEDHPISQVFIDGFNCAVKVLSASQPKGELI